MISGYNLVMLDEHCTTYFNIKKKGTSGYKTPLTDIRLIYYANK